MIDISKLLVIPVFDVKHCYHLGYDCGKNGPSTTNCHFAAFASPEKTKVWEEGKADAEAGYSEEEVGLKPYKEVE